MDSPVSKNARLVGETKPPWLIDLMEMQRSNPRPWHCLCPWRFVAGRELNPRHADFQSFFGDSRGLSINHLHRLANPFPGTPRHNPGTLNLSWSHSWHEAKELVSLLTTIAVDRRWRRSSGGNICRQIC